MQSSSIRTTKNIIVSLLVVLVCFIITVYTALCSKNDYYTYIFVLPLAFLISYVVAFRIIQYSNSIFLRVFVAVEAVRYVVLPLFIVWEGNQSYGVIAVNQNFYIKAIALCVWELIVITILVIANEKRFIKMRKETIGSIECGHENNKIYIIFCIVSVVVCSFMPRCLSEFHFVVSTYESLFSNIELSTFEKLFAYFLNISRQLICVLILVKISEKSIKKSGNIFAILICATCLSFYMGSNRADYIISAIALILLYQMIFPKVNKIFIVALLVFSIGIVIALTNVRFIGHNISSSVATNLNAYFGGVDNVAIAIGAADSPNNNLTFTNFLYEVFSPVIGANIILHGIDLPTSNIFFNKLIYGTGHVSQIIPMVGEGYTYFGFVLSPLLSGVFFMVGIAIEKAFRQSKSYIMKYFLLISTIRLGWLSGQNAMIQMNDLSYNVLFIALLYYIAKRTK